jgi:hypothetical protein
MRVFVLRNLILRNLFCWALLMVVPHSLLGQISAEQPAGAILHTQGGVWINNDEARDSTAVFPGDTIETKAGFNANLVLDGSTVLLAPESVARFQGDYLELSHGSVSVGTSKGFRVKVNCIRVIPVRNQWTQYEVSDVNRTLQVSARKDDVNVEHEGVRGKAKSQTTDETAASRASVHEGEQHNYDESEICGSIAGPTSAGLANPKWIEIGTAAGGAALLCILLCRGRGGSEKNPLSASAP